MQNLQIFQKMSPLPFQLSDNSTCMPIIVCDIFSKISSILSDIPCNPQFYHAYFLFVFKTRFLCVAWAVRELTLYTRMASNSEIHLPLPPQCWDYRHLPPLPSLSCIFLMKIFSSIIKCIHFTFQLNSNYICMAIIVLEVIFFKKSSILYIFLYFPQFYHTCKMKIFITLQKCLHFSFQLHSTCIYMPTNVTENFKIIFNFINYVVIHIYQMKIFSFI